MNLQGSDAMENKRQGPVFAPSSLPPGDWEANGIKLWKLLLQKSGNQRAGAAVRGGESEKNTRRKKSDGTSSRLTEAAPFPR